MSDLISRADVLAYPIRADHYDREHGNKHFIAGIESVMEYVECLPSAEPKTPSNGSITCVKSEKMHDRTMGDLISRQDAIDSVEFGITYAKAINKSTGEVKELFKEGNKALNEAVERLKELPSAEPEIIRCENCKHIQKWRSEESAKKFGQIYECARSVLACPKPDDFCSRAERRGEGE